MTTEITTSFIHIQHVPSFLYQEILNILDGLQSLIDGFEKTIQKQKQKIILIILLIPMRRGHKRTQSATLTFTHSQAVSDTPPPQPLRPKLEIPVLLTKSSAKIKEKVCHVESLHVSLADFVDPLFTFGTGFMAKNQQHCAKNGKKGGLMAIPEKAEDVELKPKAPERKPLPADLRASKETQGLKTSGKGHRMPFEEKGNKVIKENLSPSVKHDLEKAKKGSSILQTVTKPFGKTRGHVKHASTLK